MRAKQILGKKISHISQEKFYNPVTKKICTALKRISFYDGTYLVLSAHETDDHPYVEGNVYKPVGK